MSIRKIRQVVTTSFAAASLLLAASPSLGITVLHYSVNDTDAGTVAGGTVPGVGSPNGTVAFGTVTLNPSIPTVGVPVGSGNQSLNFNGAAGINLPGTQQLLNSTIAANGGFTMESWYNFAGGGNVNSIIDYAGTEKLVRRNANAGASMLAGIERPVGNAALGEWAYAAAAFIPTAPVAANGSITGTMVYYHNSSSPTASQSNVTISNFGDSLNRTIGVGTHPVGFGGDFFNGQLYEPRVSLGALTGPDLLYQSTGPQLIAPIGFTVNQSNQFFPAQNIINGVGLAQQVNIDNYTTVTHSGSGSGDSWVTDAFFPDYYTGGGAIPVMTFNLDQTYVLTDLVAWNYSVPGNAAREVLVEFSDDGGASFGQSVLLEIPQLAGLAHTLSLGGQFSADTVRVSFNSNWVGFGPGGDRTGLNELRFIGAAGTIPEPATMSLLALAGLAALRRRKRTA